MTGQPNATDVGGSRNPAPADVMLCEECGQPIPWDEYAVNFGWCEDCMTRHLRADGLCP